MSRNRTPAAPPAETPAVAEAPALEAVSNNRFELVDNTEVEAQVEAEVEAEERELLGGLVQVSYR